MIVETDFTSNRHTLVFENRRIDLDKSESRELELWLEQKLKTDVLVEIEENG